MRKITFVLFVALAGVAMSSPGYTCIDGCQLRYPIVLSHHFGLRKICPNDWTAEECMTREGDNVARYCADWDDAEGCRKWILPGDEANLPPRVENLFDDNLKRTSDIAQYHRYFSKAIVDRLEACGNVVYIADKPAYASYQLRSASLRRTVMQALEETGAEKVVIIGTSQGVQDARFMVAAQPADLNDPAAGTMKKHVAAIVSLAGEHQGAEVATVGMMLLYLTNYINGEGWIDPVAGEPFWAFEGGEELATDLLWREVGDTTTDAELFDQPTVLTEGYDRNNPMEYDLSLDMKFRAFLHGLTVLSRQYIVRDSYKDPDAWDALRQALGMAEYSWEDLVDEDMEACNGVDYFSYAARIRRWDYTYWGDPTFYLGVSALYGFNDGYTTMDGQNFDKIGYDSCPGGSDNFQHIKTLDGHFLSHGYYHNFFTGRNKYYGPQYPCLQEPAPYQGNAADFYEQVMRDLVARGY
ncbi:MAG: hypothetical protein SWH61_01465 [Thermodesulfobacteriota bacterium]|nr:hypothetical protein [Thermodesulfobacteriota bacterium]